MFAAYFRLWGYVAHTLKCCIAIRFRVFPRWYHYHKSEVNSMKAREEGNQYTDWKKVKTARENSGYTQEVFKRRWM